MHRMHSLYQDNPRYIESWLKSLSEKERELVDKGYVLALEGLLEQICDSKTKILEEYMKLEDHKPRRSALLHRLRMLEIYEKHYLEQVRTLSAELV